jgi:diguanylate cyclase (GGDEF)-like protein
MPVRARHADPLRRYLGFISAVGLAVGVWIIARDLAPEVDAATPAVAVLMVLVVIGELYPIRLPLHDDAEDVTTSTAFMFAILLLSGPALAIIAQGAASALSDWRARKAWWKSTFNVAQYALSIAGAWTVAVCIGSPRFDTFSAFHPRDYFATFAAGLTSFALNNLFVIVAVAIAQRASLLGELRNNLGFHALTSMVLIAQGPLIALAAHRSIVWVLLFLPGILAVYRTATISVAKEHLATHDSLTGLPNRLLFRDRLARISDDGSPFVVLLVDLDGFKEVNDTLGHHVGDSLLRQVGDRLRDGLGDVTVARLGGDEFAIVSPIGDRVDAEALGERILALLRQPFALQDLPFHIEASVGSALYPEHAEDLDTLLQRADVAMYIAKERGTGYETYSTTHDRYSPRRLALLGELRRAVDQEELVLHYQPVANLKTGEVRSVEALVRWNHPEHGLLQPAEFIPLAEPTGIMGALTRKVLDLALAQTRAWHERGMPITIAVNVSARNLHQTELANDVADLLEKWQVPASAVQLEVTEGVVMSDPRRATEVLRGLKSLGVETTLDDFGTGYSSLTYLKRLPVTTLKIDRSFVMDMATEDEDAAIVASTIELARSLGLRVVAEGVENATVWQQLTDLGCDFAQGYYLSRPIPAEQMTRWLQAHAARCSVPPVATPASRTNVPEHRPHLRPVSADVG